MTGDKIEHCTDEDLDMAIDYLYRYESDDEEDNVKGVHRVADMLTRMMEARWRRNARMRARTEARQALRRKIRFDRLMAGEIMASGESK